MIIEDNVIDNKNIILKDELLKILPITKNADIAVGYFFISGLAGNHQSSERCEQNSSINLKHY